MKPLFDVELSPESIDHFKIGALKVKLRTDRDQTSVFQNEKWHKTNTIIQIQLDFLSVLILRIYACSLSS